MLLLLLFLDGVSAVFFFCLVTAVTGTAAGGDAAAGGFVEGGDPLGVVTVAGGVWVAPGVDDAGASGVAVGDDTVCACSGTDIRADARMPEEITTRTEGWRLFRKITADYPLNSPMPMPTMQRAIATVDAQPSQ